MTFRKLDKIKFEESFLLLMKLKYHPYSVRGCEDTDFGSFDSTTGELLKGLALAQTQNKSLKLKPWATPSPIPRVALKNFKKRRKRDHVFYVNTLFYF